MSNERALTVVRAEPVATQSVADVRMMAEAAARSGLFSSVRSPEAAFTLMLLCQAEGLHPIQALRRFDIVDGRPSMKSDAMLAEFQSHGGRVTWIRVENEIVSATFSAPGIGEPVSVTWTMEDARRAGLGAKQNWQKYPRQMLRARVVSEGVRMAMPGVVVGLYTPEEVQDFDDRPRGAADPKAPAGANSPAAASGFAPAPSAPSAAGSPTRAATDAAAPAAVPVPAPDARAELRRTMTKVHGWPVVRCKNWLLKHFSTNSSSDMTDAQVADAMLLLEARAESEETYATRVEQFATEGRIVALPIDETEAGVRG